MTALLPQKLPPQTAQLGRIDNAGNVYIDINWYLFLYNLASQVLTNQNGVPASPSDFMDMVNLDAETSDIPQAYRQIANLATMRDDEISLADLAQAVKQIINVLMLLETTSEQNNSEKYNRVLAWLSMGR